MGNDWGFYCGTDAGQTGFWLDESGQDNQTIQATFQCDPFQVSFVIDGVTYVVTG